MNFSWSSNLGLLDIIRHDFRGLSFPVKLPYETESHIVQRDVYNTRTSEHTSCFRRRTSRFTVTFISLRHARTHTHPYKHTRTHTHAHKHKHTQSRTLTHTQKHRHTNTHSYTHTHAHTHAHAHSHTHKTNTLTHTHTHSNTLSHTHTNTYTKKFVSFPKYKKQNAINTLSTVKAFTWNTLLMTLQKRKLRVSIR